MNRYRVYVNVYVDAESEDDANELATQMMCGTKMMTRMWDVQECYLISGINHAQTHNPNH